MSQKQRNPRVSITPAVLPSNAFVKSFSEAIAGKGRRVSDGRWRFFQMAIADVVIVHWPDCFFDRRRQAEARRKLRKMRLAKRVFGTKFVWIAHNATPHGATQPDPGGSAFVSQLDGIVHLCHAGSKIVNTLYKVRPDTRQLITVHGRYDNAKPALPFHAVVDGSPVRLLGCGLLKPYKNFELAIDAMQGQSPLQARLRILGKDCDRQYVEMLHNKALAHLAVSVEAPSTLLEEEEIVDAVDACDLFIIPYENILNSGAALLALSRNRPIVAPDIGGLGELRDKVGSQWIYLYSGKLSPEILHEALHWVRTTHRPMAPDLREFAWEKVADDLDRFLDLL